MQNFWFSFVDEKIESREKTDVALLDFSPLVCRVFSEWANFWMQMDLNEYIVDILFWLRLVSLF